MCTLSANDAINEKRKKNKKNNNNKKDLNCDAINSRNYSIKLSEK